jgi:hypothetical protein
MTISQSQAVWELSRQGFPLAADEAESRWERGEVYRPDGQLDLHRGIKHLIDQGNWESRLYSRSTGSAS